MNKNTSKLNLWILAPILLLVLVWAIYMSVYDKWQLFSELWFMSVTMVFGSFIAGASAEGGGAVAFPVMTLLYKIPPEVARNFSLAIQSVGMTTASYLIIIKKFKVAYKYLVPASVGGTIGILIGTYYLVPIIPASFAKMLFVTFWLSFGLVLFYVNVIYKRDIQESLPKLGWFEKFTFVCVGMIGGALSSLLGSGLDIFSFSYVTMRYHLSEKIATSTSVMIMAINSIVGTVLHYFIIQDFRQQEFNYWLVCIPVVVFGAPLGAYFINKRTRGFISKFLYIIIIAQFIGAIFIIQPRGKLLLFSFLVFGFGILFFFGFSWLSKKIKVLR
jgi:uncharacterized membrane protein YfcA